MEIGKNSAEKEERDLNFTGISNPSSFPLPNPQFGLFPFAHLVPIKAKRPHI
jgi:hypothetical protein